MSLGEDITQQKPAKEALIQEKGRKLTKQIKREIQCLCGAYFEATLYTSVNVQLNPVLKEELLDGRLNLVTCSECGREQHVEIPLLYHDMERRIAIQVFPEERKDQAAEIVKEAEDMATIMKALLSGRFSEHGGSPRAVKRITDYFDYLANPHIVFGLDELAQLVAQLEGENH